MIPYGRQDITEDDVQAVLNTLTSDFITQGPQVPAFEAAVGSQCAVSNVVAVSSATAALHIACLALDLGLGDWLWTSPITFVASANVGYYCGASVKFVDIDPRTYVMCADRLAADLEEAERVGRLPKIVMPVQLCGQSADMPRIRELGRRYGFRIIEDASHAIGATFGGAPVGNCDHSDICVFSFHPVKIVTTAEGGAATTSDSELAERMRLLRSHGVTRDPKRMHSPSEAAWYYEQIELGFNYRVTELQAALGISQMKRLDDYIAARHEKRARYDASLSNLPVQLPYQIPTQRSSLHLYPILIDDSAGPNRDAVFDNLRSNGVGVNLHYMPVYRQPYHRQFGHKPEEFPNSEDYYRRALTLPLYPTLTDSEQHYVISKLTDALEL